MTLLDDYSLQAQTYDRTRGVNSAVMGQLGAVLWRAPGPELADVGGGTGNYAVALRRLGFEVEVVDRSRAMLLRARAKGLEATEGDAESLPLPSESKDAMTMISMLHHVGDPAAALAEAKRVLRPGGVLALLVFTREDVDGMWLLDYFPESRPWMLEQHSPLATLVSELPGSRTNELVLEDPADLSLAALSATPERLLEPATRSQTSYFEVLARDFPDEHDSGLRRLRSDVEAGRVPRRGGTATFISWTRAQ